MLSLISAELLKIRKRRANWIMFGIFLLFAAFFLIAIRPIIAADDGRESIEFVGANEVMRFPKGFALLIGMVSQMGRWILIVFVALLVGSEFGWGTVRQVMARGASRNGYLFAKLVAMIIAIILAMTLTLVIGSIFMVIGDLLLGEWNPDLPAGFLSDLAGDTLRTFGMAALFSLLAFCITLLSKSPGMGMGLGFVYLFVEGIFIGLFRFFGGFWVDISGYFLTSLSNAVMSANKIDLGRYFGGQPGAISDRDPLEAGLLLALYVGALLAVSVWVFNRRDIVGES